MGTAKFQYGMLKPHTPDNEVVDMWQLILTQYFTSNHCIVGRLRRLRDANDDLEVDIAVRVIDDASDTHLRKVLLLKTRPVEFENQPEKWEAAKEQVRSFVAEQRASGDPETAEHDTVYILVA
ncbi:hypothetical protein ACHAQH_009158, partial [Verticillium albo-atrum]